ELRPQGLPRHGRGRQHAAAAQAAAERRHRHGAHLRRAHERDRLRHRGATRLPRSGGRRRARSGRERRHDRAGRRKAQAGAPGDGRRSPRAKKKLEAAPGPARARVLEAVLRPRAAGERRRRPRFSRRQERRLRAPRQPLRLTVAIFRPYKNVRSRPPNNSEGEIAMNRFHQSRLRLPTIGVLSFIFLLAVAAFAAGPQTVQGPGADPECFKAWGNNTKYFQWNKKKGPYRVALDNGFIGNTWRIQMIKTAKAFAEQPGVKGNLKEFKVISTGEDLPAQIAAANNFIDAGYDAVIVNALNPAAFAPVAKRAKAAGVV